MAVLGVSRRAAVTSARRNMPPIVANFSSSSSAAPPVTLCILDGWGYRETPDNNAVILAKTPNFDKLFGTRSQVIDDCVCAKRHNWVMILDVAKNISMDVSIFFIFTTDWTNCVS